MANKRRKPTKKTKKRSTKRTAKEAPVQHELPGGFWRQVSAVIMMALALFFVVTWFGQGGTVLNEVHKFILNILGFATYFIPALLVYLAVKIFRSEDNRVAVPVYIASILMIIFGIIGAVSSVLMALISTAITAVQNDPEMQQAAAEAGLDTGAVSVVLWIGVVVLVIGAVVGIVAGVMGKKNWDNPEKGNTLLVWGIIAAVISLIGNILYATGANAASIISIITGLVLPVLYIIGVVQLKKQA